MIINPKDKRNVIERNLTSDKIYEFLNGSTSLI